MGYTLNKHLLLESLNSCPSLEQFLSTAVAEIVKAIDAKVEESIHQHELAIPSVENVLRYNTEPLVHPRVKLKVLVHLGVLPICHYKDIVNLFQLAKTVYSAGIIYDFNSPDVFYEFKSLNMIKRLGFLQFEPIMLEDGLDPRPRLRSIENQKQLIKKELAIAIYSILFDLYRA